MDPLEGQMANTPRLDPVSTKRQRIAELARDAPEMVFTSLAHHIDMHVLRAAYAATRKDGAVGLDGQTAADYAVHLEANLQSLFDRFKSGQYVAPPVRRVYIPKGDGRKTRPIGIPTFEDKVLQRAVVMVLESVYEQDFRDCSFGFRPGRSAHQALQHLWEQTMVMGGGWVIDLDIQGFFDVLDHSHLRGFLGSPDIKVGRSPGRSDQELCDLGRNRLIHGFFWDLPEQYFLASVDGRLRRPRSGWGACSAAAKSRRKVFNLWLLLDDRWTGDTAQVVPVR